jgi:predicted ATP-grasp superfamily ATP-dependent carboligase
LSGDARPDDPPGVLIAAQSGRALAAAARRAGYVPLVADLFGDLDTRELAGAVAVVPGDLARGFERAGLLAALDRLAAGRAPVGLVVGSGFERRPALLRALAGHGLLGNAAATVARLKDPFAFAALCRDCDVPHPPVALVPGEGAWLRKRAGGAGGGHVRPAAGRAVRPPHYLQRAVAGTPVSALFLADGRRSLTLGFSEQWCAPAPRRPYRYGGAVRPAALAPATQQALREATDRLARAAGLVGLNSADFRVRPDGFDLLEINPRPGATLDLFADAAGLFQWHLDACRGRLPAGPPGFAGAAAAAVVYAPRPLVLPDDFAWPAWTADRQPPGLPVPLQAPLCSVLATAADAAAARALVEHRAACILALTGGRP